MIKKSKFTFFLFVFFFTCLNSSLYAQVFQSSNTACTSVNLLCSSVGAGTCTQEIASISCKNRSSNSTFTGADFNGDTYTDCAAVSTGVGVPGELSVSVLLNNQNTTCGMGPFTSSLDYEFSGLNGGSFGSISTSALNSGNTDILVYASDQIVQAPNPGSTYGADTTTIITNNALIFGAGENQFTSNQAEKTLVSLDCDNDGDLDSAALAQDIGNNIIFQVLKNNGTNLANIADAMLPGTTNTVSAASPGATASFTVGEFTGDAFDDIAVAIAVAINDFAGSKIVICSNNGGATCSFTCSTTIPLTQHAAQNPTPFSIAAGDFNGDGNQDLVITEPGLNAGGRGLHYFYLNGSGALSSNQHITYDPLGGAAFGPRALTTGCFNNDTVVDVALSYRGDAANGSAAIVTSSIDGSGNVSLNSATALTLAAGGRSNVHTLDSADFDKQGGDDLIVLGDNGFASIFMNTVDTFSASAGATQTATPSSLVTVSDASCSSSDTNAHFTYSWAITSVPSGVSTPSLTGSNTLTPSFTPPSVGNYTLTLSCLSAPGCHSTTVATSQKVVRVSALASGRNTQGGCISSLLPGQKFEKNSFTIFASFIFLLFYSFSKKSSKKTY